MTFSIKERVWKYDINLLQFSAFTQSDIQKKEVKRNKPIHHFITEGTNDLNVTLYCYIMPEFSDRMLLKIKFKKYSAINMPILKTVPEF